MLECHGFGTVRVAMASVVVAVRRYVRGASFFCCFRSPRLTHRPGGERRRRHGDARDTARLLQLIAAKADVNAPSRNGPPRFTGRRTTATPRPPPRSCAHMPTPV